MTALFEAVLQHVPAPPRDPDAPLQLQISTLDYNSYVGRIGIGRVRAAQDPRRPARGPAPRR
jgi:GTP-binding protein